jgi:hypothetical protein
MVMEMGSKASELASAPAPARINLQPISPRGPHPLPPLIDFRFPQKVCRSFRSAVKHQRGRSSAQEKGPGGIPSEAGCPRSGFSDLGFCANTASSANRTNSAALSRHRFACHRLKPQLARFAVHVDAHMRAVQHLAVENLHRQRILNHALQRPLQRTRAVGCI